MGEVVASLGKEPGVLSCEVDLDEVSKARANYPFVDDMVELDGGNIQRCS
jgi:predicted amidohydrolase